MGGKRMPLKELNVQGVRWMRNFVAGVVIGALLVALTGCSWAIDSPAKAFGVGSQKDRTAKVGKNIFGAWAEIPLTDLKLDGLLVSYDKTSGTFTLKMDHADQNWSNTLTLENARMKDSADLYFAVTKAQQEVYAHRDDMAKEMVNHALDAAASAIGAVAKMPGGGNIASGMIGDLLGSVGPQMLPAVMSALTKHGVAVIPPPGGP